jgi:1-phosphatidylinositol-4-phosphate 5-kinase
MGIHDINININYDYNNNKNKEDISIFTKYHGGVLSKDQKSIYYFGIIDIFTNYGWKKVLENSWKSLFNDMLDISAVNPILYRER